LGYAEETAMKYLCLVYLEEERLEAMAEGEWRQLVNALLDGEDRLRASGHYVNSGALENVAAATTVRVRDGKLSVIDGPYAQTKEELGGFILIDAGDLDAAIAAAAGLPQARLGSIEIRPVRELTRFG
jgi:hypothetical protein